MYESERILEAEKVPGEMLLILVELADAGVPLEAAERALELARSGRAREGAALCLAALDEVDAALLARVRAAVASDATTVADASVRDGG